MEERATPSSKMSLFSSVSRSALRRVKKMEDDAQSFTTHEVFRFAEIIDKVDHLDGRFPHVGRETCYKTLKNCDYDIQLALVHLDSLKSEKHHILTYQDNDLLVLSDESEDSFSEPLSCGVDFESKKTKQQHPEKKPRSAVVDVAMESRSDSATEVTEIDFQLDKSGKVLVNQFSDVGPQLISLQSVVTSLSPVAPESKTGKNILADNIQNGRIATGSKKVTLNQGNEDSKSQKGAVPKVKRPVKSAPKKKKTLISVASDKNEPLKDPASTGSRNAPQVPKEDNLSKRKQTKRGGSRPSSTQRGQKQDIVLSNAAKKLSPVSSDGVNAHPMATEHDNAESIGYLGLQCDYTCETQTQTQQGAAISGSGQSDRTITPIMIKGEKVHKVLTKSSSGSYVDACAKSHQLCSNSVAPIVLKKKKVSNVSPKSSPKSCHNTRPTAQVTARKRSHKPCTKTKHSPMNSSPGTPCQSEKDTSGHSPLEVTKDMLLDAHLDTGNVSSKKRTLSASENIPKDEKVKLRRVSSAFSQLRNTIMEEGLFIMHSQPREIEECFPLAITYNVEPKKASVSDIAAYIQCYYAAPNSESLETALEEGVSEGLWKKVKSMYVLTAESINPENSTLKGQISNAILASSSPKQCLLKKLKSYVEEYHPEFAVRPNDMTLAIDRAVRYNLIQRGRVGNSKRSPEICTLVSNFVPSPAVLQGQDTLQEYHLAENCILYNADQVRKQSGERLNHEREDFSFIWHSHPRGIDDTFPLAITYGLCERSSTDIKKVTAYLETYYPGTDFNQIYEALTQGEVYKLWTCTEDISLLTRTINPYFDKTITGKILNAIIATAEPKQSSYNQLLEFVKNSHPKLLNAASQSEDMDKAIQCAIDHNLIRLVPEKEIQNSGPWYELSSPFTPSPEMLKGHDTENHYKNQPKIFYSHWQGP